MNDIDSIIFNKCNKLKKEKCIALLKDIENSKPIIGPTLSKSFYEYLFADGLILEDISIDEILDNDDEITFEEFDEYFGD